MTTSPAPIRGARIGTTERRLAAVIVLAAALPLIVAIWIGRSLAANAAALWLNPEVGRRLNEGIAAQDALIANRKYELRHTGKDLANSPELAQTIAAHDANALRGIGAAAAAEHPALLQWRIVDEDDAVVAEFASTKPASVHTLTVRAPLPKQASLQLETVFAAPEELLEQRAHAAQFNEQYTRMVAAKNELYGGHLAAFATLIGITVVATAILAVLLARGVTRRVRRLAFALQRVGRGDLTARVPVTGNDELTELASTFNEMAREISESRARIEYLKRIGEWQEMAKRLAHEIKNPLTPILLMVEETATQYRGEDPAYKKLLGTTQDVVREEVNTLRRLVTEFSNFARLPESELVRTEMDAYFADCRTSLADGEGSSVEWLGAAPGCYCDIDRQLLKRVLANLLENAKFAAAESNTPARVRVTFGSSATGLALRVDDAGAGIPEGMAERIFDPYVTLRHGGTGLGLAIAKKIVVEHGGTLTAGASQELAGACFTLELPCSSEASR